MNTPTSTPDHKNVTPTAEGQTGKRGRETPTTPMDQPVQKPAKTDIPRAVRRELLVARPIGQPDPAGFPAEPRED